MYNDTSEDVYGMHHKMIVLKVIYISSLVIKVKNNFGIGIGRVDAYKDSTFVMVMLVYLYVTKFVVLSQVISGTQLGFESSHFFSARLEMLRTVFPT